MALHLCFHLSTFINVETKRMRGLFAAPLTLSARKRQGLTLLSLCVYAPLVEGPVSQMTHCLFGSPGIAKSGKCVAGQKT